MLELLRVRAFAIIDELEVHFAPGFNVLTGETGAGKSILVDALHLVLGGRAQADSVRTGAEEAEVQALFRPRDPAACDARLLSLGLPAAGAELVVRRTLQREGRSRAWVNGSLATAAQLQAATRGLLDISGQHEHVGLLDAALHLDLLDAHAQLGGLGAEFSAAFAALAQAEKARAQLDADESQRAQRTDWLRFQLDELEKTAPQPGEDERLAQERRVLAAAEKLRGFAEEAEAALAESQAARAAKRLEDMAAIDPSLSPLAQAVRGAAAELDEASRELSRYAARAGGDPQRLEEIDERIEVLRRIARKHGGTLAAALEHRARMQAELASLENHDEELARREAEVKRLGALAQALAQQLSEKRRAAAGAFSKAVAHELSALGMAQSELSVRFNPVGEGAIQGLGPRGLETAEILLSPNPGEELRPLARIASGGELSRVLLAVKRVLAGSDPVDAYLFDEVDAGIGGATADAVGRALAAVARGRQVICITHLPHIAVFAGKHLTVEKEVLKGRTHSRVLPVDGADRVRELARLLSGKTTEVALEHARELLAAAQAPESRRRKAG
ncbi:MAG TPA: DNA repair protein RecN [Myxococcales bacterium]|nr:DNA repair protein RecN [Myxococcales bacterium]